MKNKPSPIEINKTYQPASIETKWYQHWETQGYFSPSGEGKKFSLILPPPNVTGSLHMGHGFGSTLMDILVRYQRMRGRNTLWQPGTDHAGIATQMVVERQLNSQGSTRHELGRDQFVDKIWEWKAESGDNIGRQLRRLGASLDWDRECFTLDSEISYAVREVFIRLYDQGLIYRGERLVNWDPTLTTAISDLEVVTEEVTGKMWHIRYDLVASAEYLVVATTRPETLLGDQAIAVNPDDSRYQHLIGKSVRLPLTDRTIPIIADDYVDPAFGTGCVKITPAHDFNDYAVGERHGLTPLNIFTPTAHLNENVPLVYQGLERFAARKKILADLEAAQALDKIEPHVLKVPKGERSGAVIEPYLTQQWFISMKKLAEPAIRAVEEGDVRFIPDNWNKTFYQWMENIEDWCISRQLWWGHRIPIWYDLDGNTYTGHDEYDVRQRYTLSKSIELIQDEDVLDTWFSSALWPFSSLGWPNTTLAFKSFFPTSVLVTGFDIIFFWVARMIMMSLKFTRKPPFRDVYITGLIRDAEGQKMSKSKGNVLDPIDLIDGIELEALIKKRTHGLMQPKMAEKIEKATRHEFPQGIPAYGTDALRFTFCAMASYTREIRFDMNRLTGYRNFCNKLWNASRYVLMNIKETDVVLEANHVMFTLADQWIQSRLQKTIKAAHAALKEYRFDWFAQTLYDFTWNEFCDWYLELSKPTLLATASTPEVKRGTQYTLVFILESILRLLHPVMPFITEEIWQRIAPLLGKETRSIMHETYPVKDENLQNDQAEEELTWIKNIIIAIRSLRSDINMAPGKKISVLLRKGANSDEINFQTHHSIIMQLAKVEQVNWLANHEPPPPSAQIFVGELEIFIPQDSFIDKEVEKTRLLKEIEKTQIALSKIENKLNNPEFTIKAPQMVIDKEQKKHHECRLLMQKWIQQLDELKK